jgi:DNA-binding NarL/FixJ family response regulator
LKEAVDRFGSYDFDLVILCRSIPARDRERLTCLIRASGSSVPVIAVAEAENQRDVFPNATLDEVDESSFLRRVQEIVGAVSASKTYSYI